MKKEKYKIYKNMDEKEKDLRSLRFKIVEHVFRIIAIFIAFTFVIYCVKEQCML